MNNKNNYDENKRSKSHYYLHYDLHVILFQGRIRGMIFNLKQLIDSALQNNFLIKANEKQTAVKQTDIELLRLTYQPRISTSATASMWKFLLPNKQRLLRQ
ncbi:MAG: hypothetical protein U5K51_09940 [Flavobacteriaceae bacterium]|nr:hypothetical protein [Flavobacteriaceae bacterium]